MTLSVWYWLFMALALLGGVWVHSGSTQPPYLGWGNSLVWFILFVLLGIAVFGGPIKG